MAGTQRRLGSLYCEQSRIVEVSRISWQKERPTLGGRFLVGSYSSDLTDTFDWTIGTSESRTEQCQSSAPACRITAEVASSVSSSPPFFSNNLRKSGLHRGNTKEQLLDLCFYAGHWPKQLC